MKNINSVMVVLDKPKHKQVALARAHLLQTQSGAHLHLVSFCWQAMCEEKDVFDISQRRAMKKEILRIRKEWLRGEILDRELNFDNITIDVVWTDDIASWINQRVTSGDFDLIIKAVHHSESMIHTPLDWQILRTCSAPILITSSGKRARKKKPPSGNVLAAIDLRHSDKKHGILNLRVLDAANRFAEMQNAKLHCVYVVEYSKILSDLDFIDTRKVRSKAIKKSQTLLDALIEPYPITKSRVYTPLGKVGQTVARIANKINADLLVIGTKANRSAEDALLGNSAERVLSRASCDVLAVHPS